MLADLRSDHAGETGAVCIYRGILALSRDPGLRAFAREHMATEQRHLDLMCRLVPPGERSRLLPLWRLMGWVTGALPALFGPRAVYRTVEAVESFVDDHYRLQIEHLASRPADAALHQVLVECRDDELQHRDEAAGHLGPPGFVGRGWAAMVGAGSRAGVFFASRV